MSAPIIYKPNITNSHLVHFIYFDDYFHKVIWPTVFEQNREIVRNKNVNNNNVIRISDSVDDRNIISGISIIGSGATIQRGEKYSDRNGDMNNEVYINSAYVSDEQESTRL